MTDSTRCILCAQPGGQLIWQGEHLRLIRADEAGFPAFYRIVWNTHVAEFSDLSAAQRPRDSAREAAVVAQLPMVDAALQQAFAAYCEK